MKIGLFGIGLNTYWAQFEGLLPRLEGYRRRIADRLAETGAEVVDAGMVDEPAKAEAAASESKLEVAGKTAVAPSDPIIDTYRRRLSMTLF